MGARIAQSSPHYPATEQGFMAVGLCTEVVITKVLRCDAHIVPCK